MSEIMAAVLAAIVAFAAVLAELVTSKYPRTAFLVVRCWELYLYGIIYAAIAALVYWLLPNAVGISNPWARAFALGVGVKALLHIRIFSVPTGPEKSFPIGIETLVQPFEPWLLTGIDLCKFNNESDFLQSRQTAYPDVAAARQKALDNIPSVFAGDQKAAMRTDLESAGSVRDVFSVYLKYTGQKTFNRTFPV